MDLSATTAAAVASVSAVVTTTAVITTAVDEQQDHDDEQQPRAVSFTAKQIAQTHSVFLLSGSAGFSCFHSIVCGEHCVVRNISKKLKTRENRRKQEIFSKNQKQWNVFDFV